MLRRVVAVIAIGIPLLAGSAFAEKSLWQKFKDFFSPGESIDCEGPTCDELRKVESKVNTTEGRYSRERRPMNKDRYKKELDSLYIVRDSLIAVVKSEQAADSVRAADSAKAAASQPKSSAAVVSSSSAVTVPASSAVVAPAKAEVCVHDTVYVRDTVVVHDTLYVVLANKPAEIQSAPAAEAAPAVDPSSAAAPVANDSATVTTQSK